MRYPFQPDVLDSLPEPIAELIRGLEDRLIEEICSRLKIADSLNEVTVQAIRSLRALGIDLSSIEAAIAETAKVTEEKLDELFDEVIARNQAYHEELIDMAGITAPAVIVSETDIEAIRRQTKEELSNLTASMGFLVRKHGRVVEILPPAKAYQRILDNAEVNVMAGTISYQQAVDNATRQLADGGLKRIQYEADGRTHIDQADVAARRAVLTGVNQLCQKYTEQSVERLDTNLVEVSAHSGARNTGDGPANHHRWQGKVYEWVKDGEKKTKYPDFVKTTGYGTGEGLGGWNCRHHYFPYIEGVSERTYTNEELKHIDRPPFEYQGRTYDQYHASQKQREIERTIRKYRRRKIAAEAAGLEEEAQSANIRIRRLNQLYREFSEAAGLPMQRERMKVLYPD